MSFPIVDFHCHHIPGRHGAAVIEAMPPPQRPRWQELTAKMADEDHLLAQVRAGDIASRVVNIPVNLIAGARETLPHDEIAALNDDLAALVARHPGRLHGLASVDGFDGERSAREVERAVRDLGLRGVFVDSARGDALIDAPQARPTLAAAAALGVPVFVHPIAPVQLTRQMAPYGLAGTLFARGTVNAAALIALVEGGVLQELPRLRVVVTSLAFGGLALLATLARQDGASGRIAQALRENVHIDTMGFNPALIRACVDLVGADHVVAGSDWPILHDGPLRQIFTDAAQAAALAEGERDALAGGSALRLLGLSATA
jgi:predicted TIM-barrel fold metal-dependent hydrolase